MAVLDTNFLIALEAKEAAAVNWLKENGKTEHVVPDFVAIEYMTGQADAEAALEIIQEAFTVCHGTLDWARTAVAMRKRLREANTGFRFRTPDFWIAAWAEHLGVPVITRDKSHFSPLGVVVESW